MKNKLSMEEKIYSKAIKSPSHFTRNAIGKFFKFSFFKKYGVKVNFKSDPRQDTSPHICISNHPSRNDIIYASVSLLPAKYNFVVNFNEFFRPHLKGTLKLLNTIPMKNLTDDLFAKQKISNALNSGENVFLFPEYTASISGNTQPVAIGTGKLLKDLKFPIYYAVIKGGYLSFPKYSNYAYPGHVEITFDKLFSIEDLEKLSESEIEKIVNEKLYHDDYLWNSLYRYSYKTDGNSANGLSKVLFYCPKCGSQTSMVSRGNTIWCTDCGNGATVDDTYTLAPLDDNCVIPKTQSEWFIEQREIIKKAVSNPEFSFSEKVKLGVLPKTTRLKKFRTSQILDEGVLTINKYGLSFKGTRQNQPLNFLIPSKDLPTFRTSSDLSKISTFHEGEFYEFYINSTSIEKIILLTEELHRLNGGEWQDYKNEK